MINRILLKSTGYFDSFEKQLLCLSHKSILILPICFKKLKYCQQSPGQNRLQNSVHPKENQKNEEIFMKFRQIFDQMSPVPNKSGERFHKTSFGTIRFDDENFPTEYLEKEPSQTSIENDIYVKNSSDPNYDDKAVEISEISSTSSTSCIQRNELNYIDTQYLYPDSYLEKENTRTSYQYSNKSISKKNILDVNSVDEQYFTHSSTISPPSDTQFLYTGSNSEDESTSTNTQYSNESISKKDILDVNSVDEQYFANSSPTLGNMSINYIGENISSNLEDISSTVSIESSFEKFSFAEAIDEDRDFPIQISNLPLRSNTESSNQVKDRLSLEDKLLTLSESLIKNKSSKVESMPKNKFTKSVISADDKAELKPTGIQRDHKEEILTKNPSEISSINSSQNAYDYIIKKRKEENQSKDIEDEPLHKYRKIKSEVPIYKGFLKYDYIQMLKRSVIYNDHEIIAIFKPYGIPVHGGTDDKYRKICRFNIVDSLELLAREMKTNQILPVHRLDVNTTGVLLFAKTREMADTLKKLLHDQKIKKTYLAITKGIPNPLTGVINIPIAEGKIENQIRMVLRPDIPGFRHKAGSSKQALTHFKVISHANESSLVMLSPISGIKHQIRVHLGFGIDCPVLGDHKYSHLKKMIPQKLPGAMLDHLGVKQTRVRDLPMFLHAYSVSIPNILDSKDLFIRVGPPKFFKTAMKALQLNQTKNHICEVPELIFSEKLIGN